MVILEPDALPFVGECEQGDRLGMLRFAVDALSATGARVYINARNEHWVSATEMADRLRKWASTGLRGSVSTCPTSIQHQARSAMPSAFDQHSRNLVLATRTS